MQCDSEIACAAASCVALLTSSPDVCQRILDERQGLLILRQNAASGDEALQLRALHVLRNMVHASKAVAESVCNDQGLELLSALHLTLAEGQLKEMCGEVWAVSFLAWPGLAC